MGETGGSTPVLHELDLAQKLSDYIVCVNGDTIERRGTGRDFSHPPYHTAVVDFKGIYHAELGCLEMELKGKPRSLS